MDEQQLESDPNIQILKSKGRHFTKAHGLLFEKYVKTIIDDFNPSLSLCFRKFFRSARMKQQVVFCRKHFKQLFRNEEACQIYQRYVFEEDIQNVLQVTTDKINNSRACQEIQNSKGIKTQWLKELYKCNIIIFYFYSKNPHKMSLKQEKSEHQNSILCVLSAIWKNHLTKDIKQEE